MNNSYYFTWSAQKDAKKISVDRTEGPFIFLKNGQRLDDLTSTSFQTAFGHNSKPIVQAIKNQLEAMPIAAPYWTTDLKERASQRLMDLLRLKAGKIFYTVSGAEAVENALKMARQVSGKKIILARSNSYHGASLGALSVTGDWRNKNHLTMSEYTVRIPEPADDESLKKTREIIEEAGAANIAAFCLETITGTNGVIVPSQQWWGGIQSLCKEYGILLIVDEVLVGFGRAGYPFAFQKYNLEPDFVTMSKGITGGYIPFGAVWTSSKIQTYYETNTLSCGLTNYAHPLGLAAMNAVLDFFEDQKFVDKLGQLEGIFSLALNSLRQLTSIKEVRVSGLLAAVEFRQKGVMQFRAQFAENGLSVFLKEEIVILAPPLVYEVSQLNDAMGRFTNVVRAIDRELSLKG